MGMEFGRADKTEAGVQRLKTDEKARSEWRNESR
jgi:hypothetical protein